jgi:hypothetical protein
MGCCLNEKFKTLGKPNCLETFGIIKYVAFIDESEINYGLSINTVDYTKQVGVGVNQIFRLMDLGGVAEGFIGAITDAIDNFTVEREEDVFKEYDSGNKYRIRRGRYTFNGELALPSFGQLKAFKELFCRKFSVIFLNDNKDILAYQTEGNAANTFFIKGIPTIRNSFTSYYTFANYSDVETLKFSFVLDVFDESNLVIVPYSTYSSLFNTPIEPKIYTYVAAVNNPSANVVIDTANNRLQVPLKFNANTLATKFVRADRDFATLTNVIVVLEGVGVPNQIINNCTVTQVNDFIHFNQAAFGGLTIGNTYKLVTIIGYKNYLSSLIFSEVESIDTRLVQVI